MPQEHTEANLPKLFQAVSMKSLQLQQAVRLGDDDLIRLLDREFAALISEIVDYRARSLKEVHLQLRFISAMIGEAADDRSVVIRHSGTLSRLLDRYFSQAWKQVEPGDEGVAPSEGLGLDGGDLNASILDAMPDRVAVVTTDCRYLYCNTAHAASLNVTPFEVVGRHFSDFMDRDQFDYELRKDLDSCFSGDSLECRFERSVANDAFTVNCSMSPLRGRDGRIIGAVLTMRDMLCSRTAVAAEA